MNVGSISSGVSGKTILIRWTKADMMHFPGKEKQMATLAEKKIESSTFQHFNLNILFYILYCEL